jgi:hypothetical protein
MRTDALSATGRMDVPLGAVDPAPLARPSATSWGAVVAGAVGAAALSLVLLILGVGLGLSAVSPWAGAGTSAAALGVAAIAWLTVTQLAASGLGGYLAGRLRTRWAGTHGDEVFFRDTAHGFLAWALATLLSAALLGSVSGRIVGTGAQVAAQAGGVAAAGAATAATAAAAAVPGVAQADAPGLIYRIEALLRVPPAGTAAPAAPAPADAASAAAPGMAAASAPAPTDPSAPATAAGPDNAPAPRADGPALGAPTAAAGAAPIAEIARILSHHASAATLPADDLRHIGQLIAQRTGLSTPEAEKRVADAFARLQAEARDAEAQARQAADEARRASAVTSLWLVVSLLAGAFVASFAATLGGRQRDLV